MAKSTYKQLFDYCKQGKTQLLLDALLELDDLEIVDGHSNTLLYCALKYGQYNTANKLIAQDCITSNESLALIAACQNKQDKTKGVAIALAINPDVNVINKQHRTALMTACLLGHNTTAQELLNQSADLNLADKQGNTALIEAIQSGNTKLIELMLSKKPDINHANTDGDTALLVAIKQKKPLENIIVSLLNARADPEITDKNKKSSWLIANQKYQKISRIIETHLNKINQIELPIFTNDYGTKPNNVTQKIIEPSIEALIKESSSPIADNRVEPTIELDETEATNNQQEVRKSNNQEWFHAAKTGNLGGLNRMIIQGVDINCVDNKGCSALIRACGHSRRAVVSFLLQQNADIELRSHNGSTALSSSIIGNCRRVAGLLLEKGANPNGVGPADYPYTIIAAAQWNEAMLSILYRHDADVFALNKQQQSLLHIIALAVEYYNNINAAKSSLQFLIDRGMDIDGQDHDGNTPLMLLCGIHKDKFIVDDRNIASIVHFLIKLGAAPAISNQTKESAIDATRLHKLPQTKGVLMNALSWNDA